MAVPEYRPEGRAPPRIPAARCLRPGDAEPAGAGGLWTPPGAPAAAPADQRFGRWAVRRSPEEREKTPDAAPELVGETVSHYRIVAKLGEGGMGRVYRAEDTRLGRTVALKFLPRSLTGDPGARDRLLREARAASSLDHPHICTVHDVGETADGQLYIVMACYDGETLRERLARGPLTLGDALVTAIQILEGLDAARSLGIVHRDIKPDNVLLTVDRRAKILDFGLAKLASQSSLTQTGVVVGTCSYMSPEQVRGEKVDHRSDLWSVAVVLYEMLTGHLPFAAGRREVTFESILHQPPEPLRRYRGDAPEELVRIVSRALAKKPAERYGSAAEMLADLRRLRGTLDDEPTRIDSSRRRRRRARPGWLAAAAGVPLLALAGWLALRPPAPHPPPRAEPVAAGEARLFFDQARRYEQRGDLEKHLGTAERLYRQALALEPDNPRIAAHLAALLTRLQGQFPEAGRSEESRALADRALAVDPSLALAWVARGRLSMLDGDYAAAEQAAERAVESEAENHLGYSLLGQALVAQGRVAEGLARLRRGVEIGGDGVEPRLALARELIRADRLDEAAVEYRRVLTYDPDSPNALGNLAAIYGRTGQDEEAVPLLRRALAVQPSYRDANNLGVLLFYGGRLEEAIAAFRQAHELSPDRPAPLVGLGDSYLELGDAEIAERWLRLALQKYDLALEAGGPRAHLLAGRAVCAAKLGLFDQARKDIDEALALEPTTSSLLFAAARVHALAADADACYEYVARALSAGFPRAEFHRETAFRALRDDPRFRALLESWPPASNPA